MNASTHGRQCEKNPDHWLDPTWDTCPYCEAEKRSNQRSHSGQSASGSSSDRKPTRVSGVANENPRTGTRVMPHVSPGGKPPPPPRGKRIVGVLATYDRKRHPEGDIFPIVEGRNYIGAGNITSDASERPCDILVKDDQEMSGEHALILYRHGTFELIDKETTNGTFVNGNLVPTLQGYRLKNYSRITTGKTNWTFIIITPPEKSGDPITQAPEKQDEEPPSDGGTRLY